MSTTNLPAAATQSFESLKQNNEHGAEYWSARDLQPLLGYSQWRRFEQAVDRAKASCATSGNSPEHHFAGAGKPITGGKGAVQVVDDCHLSRFACYPNLNVKKIPKMVLQKCEWGHDDYSLNVENLAQAPRPAKPMAPQASLFDDSGARE